MKMNYRLIHSVKSKASFFGLGMPLFFIGALVVFHFVYPSGLGSLIARVALPFWSVERSLGEKTHTFLSFFSSRASLATEVEKLSSELADANRLLLDRDLLTEENAMLKEQFGRATKKNQRTLGAILATPPRSPYDTAVLDIGRQNGVEVGDLALSGSVVLGLVGKVHGSTSVIEFFSTAGRKTLVSILHSGKAITVEGVGRGGGEFTATLPKETEVGVGDAVVMPGLNPLLFATVEAIESSVTDSFEVIRFKNPFPISSLRFLEIEKAEHEQ